MRTEAGTVAPVLCVLLVTAAAAAAGEAPAVPRAPGDALTLDRAHPRYAADQPAAGGGADGGGGGGGGSSEDLAKKLANPIADLISVPLQFNYDEGYGPRSAFRLGLNVQPVVPITLNRDWNVISRTIVPLVYREAPSDLADDEFGMGDVTQSLFFSPRQGKLVWGVGPVFLLPSATDDSLGGEKWGAGPTGVVLVQDGPWTYGLLANHLWSFAGDDDRADVNATFVQPFLAYTTRTATTFTLNTESTYDWTAHEWTVPINLQVSQLMKLGGMPVSVGVGGRYYAETPGDGPEWGVRFVFTFLFPK